MDAESRAGLPRPLSVLWAAPFLAAAVVHLAALSANWVLVAMATKVALMPTLALWVSRQSGLGSPPAARWLMAALGLSWGGDVLLLFSAEPGWGGTAFLGGLGLFLLAHLAYIRTFRLLGGRARGAGVPESSSESAGPKPTGLETTDPVGADHSIEMESSSSPPATAPTAAMIFTAVSGAALYLVLFMRMLWGGLDPVLKIAVPLYAAVILAMALTAAGLRGRLGSRPLRALVLGAVLFVVSDSLIAVDRFAFEIPHARLLIMSSYLAAQALLAAGVVRSLR